MHDDGLNTSIAGIRCREVLADLSEFVDGALSSTRIVALQAHLAECDRCTRFGGDVVRLLTALRAGLSAPPLLSHESSQRLHARLAEVMRER